MLPSERNNGLHGQLEKGKGASEMKRNECFDCPVKRVLSIYQPSLIMHYFSPPHRSHLMNLRRLLLHAAWISAIVPMSCRDAS